MRSASRSPRLICHQPVLAVPRGFAERRSGYSDNSTARMSHLGDAKTTDHPGGITPRGPRCPRLRRVAFCSRRWTTSTPLLPATQHGPTWRIHPYFPRRQVLPEIFHGVLVSGNSSRLRHSLFALSGFFEEVFYVVYATIAPWRLPVGMACPCRPDGPQAATPRLARRLVRIGFQGFVFQLVQRGHT